MTLIDPYTLTSSDVARELNLSAERVRQLDALLLPVRRVGSRHRRYDPAIVVQVKADRTAR